MFGKNRQAMAAKQAELAALEPYIGIAREIREGVARLALGGMDLDKAYTEVIQAMSTDKQRETVLRVFDNLPVETRWEKLHAFFGDEALKAVLQSTRERELAALANPTAELRRIAMERGTFDLRSLRHGQRVQLLFCQPELLPAAREVPEPNKPLQMSGWMVRLVTGIATGADGMIRVMSDKNDALSKLGDMSRSVNRPLPDHSLVTFGTINASTAEFEPGLYFDSMAAMSLMENNGEATDLALDFAAARVDGVDLLPRK